MRFDAVGAIVVGPVRRGRGRRVRVERRVIPVTADEDRRHEVFERELWRIAVEFLDYGEQHMWAALAGARVAPSGWRRARAMLHFDRTGELKRRFLLTAVERNRNSQLRLRALQEIAAAKDAEAFDLSIDIIGMWPRDERREGTKIMLQALAEKRIGRRDQANAWIWRLAEYTREVHEEYAVQRWPETKRLLGLLVNSSGGAHARNARRLVHAARKHDRRLSAALLAAAVAHTPEAEEVLRGARTRMARKPSALSRELLRNFPKGKGRRSRRRRKKVETESGAAAATAEVAVQATGTEAVEDAAAEEVVEAAGVEETTPDEVGATASGPEANGRAPVADDHPAASSPVLDAAAAVEAAARAASDEVAPKPRTRRRRTGRAAASDADGAAVEATTAAGTGAASDGEAAGAEKPEPRRRRRATIASEPDTADTAAVDGSDLALPPEPAAADETPKPVRRRGRDAAAETASEASVEADGSASDPAVPEKAKPVRRRRTPTAAETGETDATVSEAAEAAPAEKPKPRRRRKPAESPAAEATPGAGATPTDAAPPAEEAPKPRRRRTATRKPVAAADPAPESGAPPSSETATDADATSSDEGDPEAPKPRRRRAAPKKAAPADSPGAEAA